ncbi:hypothetical protein RHGRI_002017 [Rhododendron griersonianum]|uniref:Uncharacterized protein n=1 Tax=Rhododendron griersonianum TaxID=479676 RepID=A0AAV6LMT9_9ERIC|nr:hypothetical protein RHGRI_002017 [Rhododendron griersonianum]
MEGRVVRESEICGAESDWWGEMMGGTMIGIMSLTEKWPGVIVVAGANLQDVVFEVLSEINGPVGFQVTKGLHHVESLPAVASFS